MSYRPYEQELRPGISQILGGIMDLNKSIDNRISNFDEFTEEHINELYDLKRDLLEFDFKLRKISKDNW